MKSLSLMVQTLCIFMFLKFLPQSKRQSDRFIDRQTRQKTICTWIPFRGHKHNNKIMCWLYTHQAKSRKYRGIFEEHSPEKYRQVRKKIGLNKYNICKSERDGTRRSKRHLSACHTRCKCSMETSQNSVKGWVRDKSKDISNMYSMQLFHILWTYRLNGQTLITCITQLYHHPFLAIYILLIILMASCFF